MNYDLPVVLLVSHSLNRISLFERSLKETYYLLECENPALAEDLLKNTSIDFIVLDEKALEDSLIPFCHRIRKLANYEHIPILLITNNLKKTFTSKAQQAGVTHFLNEPLEEEDILKEIAAAKKAEDVSEKMAKMAFRIGAPLSAKEKEILHHRFLLSDQAIKTIAKAQTSAFPLSLLLFAVDSYDEIIKARGKEAGDKLPIFLTPLLKKHLRQFDSLFSQGMGRFLILLPKTSASAARTIAETIREETNKAAFVLNKKALSLTVSIGLVIYKEPPSSSESEYQHLDLLLSKVDQALIEAKKKGNEIVLKYGDPK